MRITLHLDTFDTDPCAYAILWLDDQSLKWSRESHAGLTLPEWGTLRTEAGSTRICGSSARQPLFTLEGLALGKQGGPFEGEDGLVHRDSPDSTSPASGHWHVQCVDTESIEPEFGIFAGDEAA